MNKTSKTTKFVLFGISMMALTAFNSCCGSSPEPAPAPQPPIIVEPIK